MPSPGRIALHLRRSLRYQWGLLLARLRWRTLTFSDSPVIFANAMPKSGSNLLLQIMRGLHTLAPLRPVHEWPLRMITEGGRVRALEEVMHDLHSMRPGSIGWGYLHALPETRAALGHAGWVSFFLVRDPRDVLVSHVFYATEIHAGHSMRPIYQQLDSFDERLHVAIAGTSEYPFLPDAAKRYEPFLGFLDQPEVHLLRFEDLRQRPERAIGAIMGHVRNRSGLALKSDASSLARVMRAIDPAASPTFRQGSVGGWRKHFRESHKEHFKRIAGDLLQRLGYETDSNW